MTMPVKKTLKIGLPITNRYGIAEHLLFMFAGQFQWDIIAEKLGSPLSGLRTKTGDEIYATFFSVELEFTEKFPRSGFRLDDTLGFLYDISAYKNLIIDGKMVFGPLADVENLEASHPGSQFYDEPLASDLPRMRMSNILITPRMGNENLKIAPPAGVSFDAFSKLDPKDRILSISGYVEKNKKIGYFDAPPWNAEFGAGSYEYRIFPERDTNGAGLVYFANYIAFIHYAEAALHEKIGAAFSRKFERLEIQKRHIVYMGNVSCDDSLEIGTECFRNASRGDLVGLRHLLRRKYDGKLIAVSESIKAFV